MITNCFQIWCWAWNLTYFGCSFIHLKRDEVWEVFSVSQSQNTYLKTHGYGKFYIMKRKNSARHLITQSFNWRPQVLLHSCLCCLVDNFSVLKISQCHPSLSMWKFLFSGHLKGLHGTFLPLPMSLSFPFSFELSMYGSLPCSLCILCHLLLTTYMFADAQMET